MRHLNYNHLHYFWTVAKEGSVARAAERLYLTPQTISGQVRLLEQAVGGRLFNRTGRGLVLSENGQFVFRDADEIFSIGSELADVLRGRSPEGPRLLTVGVADVLPKLIAYRILEPAMRGPDPAHIVCREARLDDLLSELAVHRLDLVLSDSPIGAGLSLRAFNHPLGKSTVSFFARTDLLGDHRAGFPRSLDGLPVLFPSAHTALRRALEQWLEREGIRPRLVGEFQDSALMKAFGQAGAGAFPAPSVIETEVCRQYGVEVLGKVAGVRERFYAISPRAPNQAPGRRRHHRRGPGGAVPGRTLGLGDAAPSRQASIFSSLARPGSVCFSRSEGLEWRPVRGSGGDERW